LIEEASRAALGEEMAHFGDEQKEKYSIEYAKCVVGVLSSTHCAHPVLSVSLEFPGLSKDYPHAIRSRWRPDQYGLYRNTRTDTAQLSTSRMAHS
jgi:hypothetical protein